MKHLSFFVAVLALCTLGSPGFSQSIDYPSLDKSASVKKTGKNDVAIIVAVENYVFLPAVKGAIANANDWETFFKSSLGVGKVHMLVDRQATREQVERFARTAAQESKSGGTVWFVFIGHGSPAKSGKDGLLVGVDAQQDPDSLFARGFAQQDLLNLLNAGKQEQTVVIVDACFSGRAPDGQALAPAQPVIPTTLNLNLAKKTVIFSAAESSEFAGSLPGADRPAFSYLLLGALHGWSNSNDGNVTAQDALSFTQRSLRGIPGRFQQTPGIYGNDKLVLVRSAKEKDPGVYDLMRRTVKHNPSNRPYTSTCPSGMYLKDEKCVPDPLAQLVAACDLNESTACNSLGLAYKTGKGRNEDLTRANDLFEKACNMGSASGCTQLAWAYARGEGRKQDLAQAGDLFEKSCNMGLASACSNLGWVYEKGKGRNKDSVRASDLYEKACNMGEPTACSNLGGAYLHGIGRAKDSRRADELFKKACSMGHAKSCTRKDRSGDTLGFDGIDLQTLTPK